MTSLLDVNVLVALFDPSHVHHEKAHDWFGGEGKMAWASCPLTENGFVRVCSNPRYAGRRTTVSDALDRLRTLRAAGGHVFWPDSASLIDAAVINSAQLTGHNQLTDVYLLCLAVQNGGRLVTFDRRIPLAAVVDAGPNNLLLL